MLNADRRLNYIDESHQLLHDLNIHSFDDLINTNRSDKHRANPAIEYKSYGTKEFTFPSDILDGLDGVEPIEPMPTIDYINIKVNLNSADYWIIICCSNEDYDTFVNYLTSNLDVTISLLTDYVYSHAIKNLIYFCGSVNLTPQQKLYLDMELNN